MALPLSLMAQPNSTPLKAGGPVPDVSLKTDTGETVSLRKLVSEKPAVLIFYRGGWCPYCTRHLQALAGIEKDLLAAGYQLVAISADQPSKLREKPDFQKLTYTLLSDSPMDAAKGFGIAFEVDAATREKYLQYGIDLEAASGQLHHMLPHPAVFIVDTKGVIHFAYVNEDYKVRLEPEKILEAARNP
jgi:peroxiredoxin